MEIINSQALIGLEFHRKNDTALKDYTSSLFLIRIHLFVKLEMFKHIFLSHQISLPRKIILFIKLMSLKFVAPINLLLAMSMKQ